MTSRMNQGYSSKAASFFAMPSSDRPKTSLAAPDDSSWPDHVTIEAYRGVACLCHRLLGCSLGIPEGKLCVGWNRVHDQSLTEGVGKISLLPVVCLYLYKGQTLTHFLYEFLYLTIVCFIMNSFMLSSQFISFNGKIWAGYCYINE